MNTKYLHLLPHGPAALFLLLFVLVQSGQSQPFNPGAPEILVDTESEFYMNPVWSPDGEHIAFTSSEFRGIWTVAAEGNDIRQITDEHAVGYGFSWSSDGSAIAGRPARYEERHRLNAIKVYEVSTGAEQILKDYTRERTGLPQWTDLDQKIAVPQRESFELIDSGIEATDRPKRVIDESVVLSRDNRIEKTAIPDLQSEVVREFEDSRILNTTISPDGSKIAFQLIGEGLFVMHADGSNLRDLGRAEHPVWLPDGEFLIAMTTEDDGHRITNSEIYAIEVESGERHALTTHDNMGEVTIPLYPTISPDGQRIAFGDNETGRIYTMTIR